MKRFFDAWVLIFILLLIAMYVNMNTAFREMEAEREAKEMIHQQEKEELEKEIRLLKTDLCIVQYGYEEE